MLGTEVVSHSPPQFPVSGDTGAAVVVVVTLGSGVVVVTSGAGDAVMGGLVSPSKNNDYILRTMDKRNAKSAFYVS